MPFDFKKFVAKDVYSKDVLSLYQDNTIADALDLLFSKSVHDIFIVDRQCKLLGMVSPEGVAYNVSKNSHNNIRMRQIMVKIIAHVTEDCALEQCKNLMREIKRNILPVVKGNTLIGTISMEQIREYESAMSDAIAEQLEVILRNLYEGVCAVDLDSKVTYWNASAERIYGVKAADIIGKPLGEFFPGAILLKVLENGKSYENIKHFPRDGTEVVISARPVLFKGKMVSAISSERDISDVRDLSIKLKQARNAVQFLEQEVYKKTLHSDSHIIGSSKCFSNVLNKVRQSASSDANIMLIGESGSGKEVIARFVHKKSDRKGLFVPVNCSAIPPELFESEFFGYEYGAFTGASKHGKAGYFELAQGGTLFLDEVAELPALSQAKLLRVVEDGEVRRIGSEKSIKTDVRIISATHRNLHDMAAKGDFREDLYYRLEVIRLRIPSLRDRGNDILLFIEKFLEEIGRKNQKIGIQISQDALACLLAYSWKGNVRELRNCIEQMVILCEDNFITREDVPPRIRDHKEVGKGKFKTTSDLCIARDDLEKNMIQKALAKCNYNKSATARLLGIKRTTLYYKLKSHGLEHTLNDEKKRDVSQ